MIPRRLLPALLAALCLLTTTTQAQDQPSAETKAQRDQRMAWWRDAKFGLFIHWGVYAVPAGTYNDKKIGGIGEWIMLSGQIPVAEYRAFAKKFNPVKYNPDAWAALAEEAGMKYIVITSKHHDGFALFPSDVTDWDIADATPYGKDLIIPLADAAHKHGLKFGTYYSQSQDWTHPGGAKAGQQEGGGWDDAHKGSYDEYLAKIAVPQTREILTRIKPDILWWDTPVWMTPERAKPLYDLIPMKPGLITNNRLGGGFAGDTETPEQHIPATGFADRDWETCMTMNDTWGFKSYDDNWKPVETLIRNLVDIVSKGGNYLLNVGPTAEGEIPQPSIERLKAVGKWMKTNGEAIYGTSASPFKRLDWGRCTRKPGKLYLHVFDWPKDGKLTVPMKGSVSRAYLLADPEKKPLQVSAPGESGITITTPATAPDPIASVIVVEVQGEIEPFVQELVVPQAADGKITLGAAEAEVKGSHAKLEAGGLNTNIGFWTDAGDSVRWTAQVKKPGTFKVQVVQACETGTAGTEYDLVIGGKTLKGKVAATNDWKNYKNISLGTITIPEAGKVAIEVKPTKMPGYAVMNLRAILLEPAAQ